MQIKRLRLDQNILDVRLIENEEERKVLAAKLEAATVYADRRERELASKFERQRDALAACTAETPSVRTQASAAKAAGQQAKDEANAAKREASAALRAAADANEQAKDEANAAKREASAALKVAADANAKTELTDAALLMLLLLLAPASWLSCVLGGRRARSRCMLDASARDEEWQRHLREREQEVETAQKEAVERAAALEAQAAAKQDAEERARAEAAAAQAQAVEAAKAAAVAAAVETAWEAAAEATEARVRAEVKAEAAAAKQALSQWQPPKLESLWPEKIAMSALSGTVAGASSVASAPIEAVSTVASAPLEAVSQTFEGLGAVSGIQTAEDKAADMTPTTPQKALVLRQPAKVESLTPEKLAMSAFSGTVTGASSVVAAPIEAVSSVASARIEAVSSVASAPIEAVSSVASAPLEVVSQTFEGLGAVSGFQSALSSLGGGSVDMSNAGLEKLFTQIDADGSGKISNDEMLQALSRKYPGRDCDPSAITQMMAAADTDKDGEVSMDEFKAVMRAQSSKPSVLTQLPSFGTFW